MVVQLWILIILPLINAVVGGVVGALLVDPIKNWWAKRSEGNTLKRIESIEADLKVKHANARNPTSLIPILGGVVITLFLMVILLGYICFNYLLWVNNLEAKRAISASGLQSMNNTASIIFSVAIAVIFLVTMNFLTALRNTVEFDGYKVKQEKTLAELKSKLKSPPFSLSQNEQAAVTPPLEQQLINLP